MSSRATPLLLKQTGYCTSSRSGATRKLLSTVYMNKLRVLRLQRNCSTFCSLVCLELSSRWVCAVSVPQTKKSGFSVKQSEFQTRLWYFLASASSKNSENCLTWRQGSESDLVLLARSLLWLYLPQDFWCSIRKGLSMYRLLHSICARDLLFPFVRLVLSSLAGSTFVASLVVFLLLYTWLSAWFSPCSSTEASCRSSCSSLYSTTSTVLGSSSPYLQLRSIDLSLSILLLISEGFWLGSVSAPSSRILLLARCSMGMLLSFVSWPQSSALMSMVRLQFPLRSTTLTWTCLSSVYRQVWVSACSLARSSMESTTRYFSLRPDSSLALSATLFSWYSTYLLSLQRACRCSSSTSACLAFSSFLYSLSRTVLSSRSRYSSFSNCSLTLLMSSSRFRFSILYLQSTSCRPAESCFSRPRSRLSPEISLAQESISFSYLSKGSSWGSSAPAASRLVWVALETMRWQLSLMRLQAELSRLNMYWPEPLRIDSSTFPMMQFTISFMFWNYSGVSISTPSFSSIMRTLLFRSSFRKLEFSCRLLEMSSSSEDAELGISFSRVLRRSSKSCVDSSGRASQLNSFFTARKPGSRMTGSSGISSSRRVCELQSQLCFSSDNSPTKL